MSIDKSLRVAQIVEILKKEYPSPKTELVFNNEMQLAIAVMLSAQTTDKKVNQITEKLFKKYLSWEDFAQVDVNELEKDIHGVNFHKGKAERIKKAAQLIISNYHGGLPRNISDLILIPGVARKTANVILQELWGITEGIVVDTHIARVSQRLELTANTNPVLIEKDLMKILSKDTWRLYSGAIVLHGRYVCTARKPKCTTCVLKDVCPSYKKFDDYQ